MLTAKQEAFALYLFQDVSQREAWKLAGYSTNYSMAALDVNASHLANLAKVKLRVKELRNLAATSTIATVIERKERLSEILRANLTDFIDDQGNITLKKSGALAELVIDEDELRRTKKRLKLRDPIAAIQELNKMERIGQDEKPQYNDNRQYNFVVVGDDAEGKLKQLLSGEKPKAVEPPR